MNNPVNQDFLNQEWRDWVIAGLRRDCSPQEMCKLMMEAQWPYEVAAQAIDDGNRSLGRSGNWRLLLPTIPNAKNIDVGGKTIKVLSRIERPNAVLLDGILSDDEASALIDLAFKKGLQRSGVVDDLSGSSVPHDARTSSSIHFKRGETPLIKVLEERLAALTNWPLTHAEGLQVLRYEPGQQYKAHFDWFDSAKPGSEKHLNNGGQRLGTTVVYLATAEQGGGTRFPEAGVEVLPHVGGAVFFRDVSPFGEPDPMSLHSGCPVISGTKIVATYWQRESAVV